MDLAVNTILDHERLLWQGLYCSTSYAHPWHSQQGLHNLLVGSDRTVGTCQYLPLGRYLCAMRTSDLAMGSVESCCDV
jgi:hypothetical protein